MSISKELAARGFINQFSAETAAEILDGPVRTVYHGIDPTADSAHAGNFVNWMLLRHLVRAGHQVIFLVGGGTGLIGDPKTDVERPTSDPEVVATNVEKLRQQAEHLLGTDKITFVNNHDWLTKIALIDFLRDIGKHFTVNELIKKEAIATRLAGETGISYREFTYPLLQAYDYLVLNREYECDVQVGGSDQWGNIVAGVDLVRRVEGKQVYALTTPLIVDKTTGKKFGKSEGNAVWLDKEKTSPYQFYQFWYNTTDDNVIDYLKLFTDLPLEEIEDWRLTFEKNPEQRGAQRALAYGVTEIVHGVEQATAAESVSELLFGTKQLVELSSAELAMLQASAPLTIVSEGTPVVEVLVETGLATSKREARTFIESGAISLQEEKITSVEAILQLDHFTNGLTVIRRGKKQLRVLQMDEV